MDMSETAQKFCHCLKNICQDSVNYFNPIEFTNGIYDSLLVNFYQILEIHEEIVGV